MECSPCVASLAGFSPALWNDAAEDQPLHWQRPGSGSGCDLRGCQAVCGKNNQNESLSGHLSVSEHAGRVGGGGTSLKDILIFHYLFFSLMLKNTSAHKWSSSQYE